MPSEVALACFLRELYRNLNRFLFCQGILNDTGCGLVMKEDITQLETITPMQVNVVVW